MTAAVFVVATLLLLAIAHNWAVLLLPSSEPYLQTLAAFAGVPLVAQFVLLAVGMAGFLSPTVILLTLVVILACTVAVSWILGRRWFAARPTSLSADVARNEDASDPSCTIALAGLALFVGLWINQVVFAGTEFTVDDLSYHAPEVAHWFRTGSLALAPTEKYAYYPANAELLTLWPTIFFRDDALAGLAGFYWGLLAAAGAGILAKQLGGNRLGSLLTATMVLSTPDVLRAAKTFCAVDLAGPASLLAALVFVVAAGAATANRIGLPLLIYGGGLAGFAAGCKVHYVPAVAILMLLIGWRSRRTESWRAAIPRLLVFSLAASVTGGFWYARNLIVTGNPLYPAQIGPFPGWQTASQLAITKLSTWILHRHLSFEQWLYLVRNHINFPLAIFAVVVVAYLKSIATLFSRRVAMTETQRSAMQAAVCVGLLLFCLYPWMPYSATNEVGAILRVERRYMLAPVLLGLALFGGLLDAFNPRRTLWIGCACVAIVSGGLAMVRPLSDVSEDASVAGICALAVLAVGSLVRWRPNCLPWRAVVVTLVVVGLAALHPLRVRRTAYGLFHWHGTDVQRPVGAGWEAVDQLPDGSKIVGFSQMLFLYPLYGRRFQLVPVSHHLDGSWRDFDHLSYRATGKRVDELAMPLDDLIANLQRQDVDYILLSRWELNEWPPQRAVILDSAAVSRTFDDGYSEIWQLEKKAD